MHAHTRRHARAHARIRTQMYTLHSMALDCIPVRTPESGEKATAIKVEASTLQPVSKWARSREEKGGQSGIRSHDADRTRRSVELCSFAINTILLKAFQVSPKGRKARSHEYPFSSSSSSSSSFSSSSSS